MRQQEMQSRQDVELFFLLLAAIDDLRGWLKGLIMRVCTGSHALKFFFPSISFNYDA